MIKGPKIYQKPTFSLNQKFLDSYCERNKACSNVNAE